MGLDGRKQSYLRTRATRLGDFSPIGRLFTFGRLFAYWAIVYFWAIFRQLGDFLNFWAVY
jgi:hypothetical protein